MLASRNINMAVSYLNWIVLDNDEFSAVEDYYGLRQIDSAALIDRISSKLKKTVKRGAGVIDDQKFLQFDKDVRSVKNR